VNPFLRASRRRDQFAELVRAHGVGLATLARRLVGADDVDDVVQAALAAAWRQFRSAEVLQYPRAWLSRFVVHESGNRIGLKLRRPATVGLEDFDRAGSPDDIVTILQRELAHASIHDPRPLLDYVNEGLARAIGGLTDEERMALVLRSVAEYSYKEIADATSVPIGTVMSRLCRAREKVRSSLGHPSDGATPGVAPGRVAEGVEGGRPHDGELR